MLLFFIIVNQVNLPMEQVSFDAEGKIYVITEKQEKVLHLFPDVSNFYEATLFKTSQGNYILKIKTKVDGKFYLTERNITEDDLQRIRSTLSLQKGLFCNREGYGLFALSNFELALGEWGIYAAIALEDGRVYPLVASAGFFTPLILKLKGEITYGEVAMSWLMAKHGVVMGASIYSLTMSNTTDISGKSYGWSLLSGSILGDIFGYYWAQRKGLSAGRSWMYHHMMWSGEYYGGLLGGIFSQSDNTTSQKLINTGILLGGAGGFLFWDLHKGDEYSWGTALSYDTYSYLMLFTGLNITSYFNDNNGGVDKSKLGFNILFHSVFNYIGMKNFANKNISGMDGLLHLGGSIAGGLLAGGLLSFTDVDARAFSTGTLAGAWLGYGAAYMITLKGSHNHSTTGFNIEFTPEAPLFGYLTHQKKSMPLLTIKF